MSSTDWIPIRFALAASASTVMSLKHHLHTDCLMAEPACAADVDVETALIVPPATPGAAVAPAAPLDAHAETPAPSPAIAPPSATLCCTNSRRVGIASPSALTGGGRRATRHRL